MSALREPTPNHDRYFAYLLGQWRLHEVLETALLSRVPPAWVEERLIKRHWLASDLAALSGTTDGVATQALPRLEPISGDGQALGIMYVLEGSTLGLRMLKGQLPLQHPGRTTAGRFLEGYGDAHALRWRTFLEYLERLDRAAWPMALAAAQGTFQLFLAQFETSMPPGSGVEP